MLGGAVMESITVSLLMTVASIVTATAVLTAMASI
jgi:hypothetical protein